MGVGALAVRSSPPESLVVSRKKSQHDALLVSHQATYDKNVTAPVNNPLEWIAFQFGLQNGEFTTFATIGYEDQGRLRVSEDTWDDNIRNILTY